MIVHRFMSEQEFQQLMQGKMLVNNTNHAKVRKGKSTCRGFCFFVEEPDDAVHWLSGIVDLDVCVTLEVDDNFLRKGYGIYADETDKALHRPMNLATLLMNIKYVKRQEYWRVWYSLDDVKVVEWTDKYKDKYPSKEVQMEIMKVLLSGGYV